jgi:hypothetical protein
VSCEVAGGRRANISPKPIHRQPTAEIERTENRPRRTYHFEPALDRDHAEFGRRSTAKSFKLTVNVRVLRSKDGLNEPLNDRWLFEEKTRNGILSTLRAAARPAFGCRFTKGAG